MDIAKIKVVLLALEKKSFSKAAEELSYTPSALSHIADSLESELGVKILNRTFTGIELTENGKIIYPHLKSLIDAEQKLLLEAEKINRNDNFLRIGTYSSIAQNLLPQILKKYKQEYPFVTTSIKVSNVLTSWLEDDVADVIFTDSPPANATWLKILDDPFMAIYPVELLPNKKTVSKEDLYQHACIIQSDNIIKNNFELDKFKEVISFDSIDESSIFSMVKENIGIAVLPQLMLKNKGKFLRAVKLSPEISREIGCAYKKEKEQSACAKHFIKFIKKEFSIK
jgi:DNA-binding transcriptional LysR family regulator